MRFLIQHKKEFAITVAAFIMAAINLIKAIRSGDVTEDLIVAVLVTGTTILAWYYNMPTSQENSDYTEMMRQIKRGEGDAEDVPHGFFEEEDDDDESDSE